MTRVFARLVESRASQALARTLALGAALLLSACSVVRAPDVPSLPNAPSGNAAAVPRVEPVGQQIAARAALQLGAPYRFGGSDPAGFDCSGLVSFVHADLGIRVPRTAAAQSAAAIAVPRDQLDAGDLVFFRSGSGDVDHVAIYAGNGELLHAPGRGRVVERIRLDDPWFRARYAGAGRFWTAPATPGP